MFSFASGFPGGNILSSSTKTLRRSIIDTKTLNTAIENRICLANEVQGRIDNKKWEILKSAVIWKMSSFKSVIFGLDQVSADGESGVSVSVSETRKLYFVPYYFMLPIKQFAHV